MRPDAARWFARRTWRAVDAPSWSSLLALKGGQSISVVVPALDEAPTVGAVVAAAHRLVLAGLVDEVLVVDGGSADGTSDLAAAAGARVVARQNVLPGYGDRPGKGESLWKALDATDGDLLVYLDADVTGASPAWIAGLLWPLLAEPAVSFVKACYDRPLALLGGQVAPTGGGRVTELTARPLIDLLWPELAGVVQPLAGEYAGRRSLLESLPYSSGYAVELGLLLDAHQEVGLDGLAQVDLGVRRHRNRGTSDLGRMSAAILAEALARAGTAMPGGTLTQFVREGVEFAPQDSPVGGPARPPMLAIHEYAVRRARAS